MTVEEFYQQQYGASKEEGGGGGDLGEGGEEGEEDESEVALKKAREWDDFKDGKCMWYSRYMSSCFFFMHREQERMGQQEKHGIERSSYHTLAVDSHCNTSLSIYTYITLTAHDIIWWLEFDE